MTLIAKISANGFPMLIGDLLVASKLDPKRAVVLPTFRELPNHLVLPNTHYVSGVAQKICIVNRRLMVAWSGRMIYARDVIGEMKKHFRHRSVDKRALEKFFVSQDQLYMRELQIVCLYRQVNTLSSFGVNITSIDTVRYGHCYVGGSGAGDFIGILYQEKHDIIQPVSGSLLDGILVTFGVVGDLLAREMRSGYSIISGYGGGFEIATFAEGQYRKIGDVLHLSWICNKDKQGYDIEFVPVVYKLDYLNDQLLIRRLGFGDFDKNNEVLPIKNNDVFSVSPLVGRVCRKISVDELPDLNATYFFNHLYIRDGAEEKEKRIIVSYSPERRGPVKFMEMEKTIVIGVNMTFMRRCLMAGM